MITEQDKQAIKETVLEALKEHDPFYRSSFGYFNNQHYLFTNNKTYISKDGETWEEIS